MPDPLRVSSASSVAFAELGAFSDLFVAYTSAYERLAAYYAGDFRNDDARREAARKAAEHPRDRQVLVDVLLEQNASWGLDDGVRQQIEKLRDPAAIAVVTGQQLGLCGGPLYTLYKTITAVQLARRLEEETGRPAVPVFWLEGEDHDFDEVDHVTLLKGNDPVRIRYTAPEAPDSGNTGPVGRMRLNEEIVEVLAQIDQILPPTEFKPALMEHLGACYRPGVSFRTAFARLMSRFFAGAGLVFISPDDDRLKRQAAPLFRAEIEDFATSAGRLDRVSVELAERYHAQVRTRSLNLFMIEPNGRFTLEPENGQFHLRGTNLSYTADALLDILDAEPHRFSPNVVLRPLMQDWLLPTAAYVAGPGEVAYFAQFKPLYDWSGVPMPVIYPRASATLVESKVRKVLDRYGIDLGALGGDVEALFRRLVVDQMDVDVDASFKQASRHLHEAVNEVKPVAASADRTLERSAESTRAALMKEFFRFKDRVVRAEKRNHDEIRNRLDKARANLFPDGKLQERSLSVLHVLNKYGVDFPVRALDIFSLDTTKHHLLDL